MSTEKITDKEFEEAFRDKIQGPDTKIYEKKAFDDNYNFAEKAEEVARKRGLIIVYPTEYQLQIDIDSEEQYQECICRIEEMFGRAGEYPLLEVRPSAGGMPRRHITLTFREKKFEEWERMAFQAALGDDPIRNYLNVKRKLNGDPKPSRLFEKPHGTDQKEAF